MSNIRLVAQKRTVSGKKVKKLRREGKLPANIFGKDIKSLAIQIEVPVFKKAFKIAHTTHVVYVDVDKKEFPVLIQTPQYHPITGTLLHVDMRKVDLKQKVETEVPVQIVGELSVVKSGEADAVRVSDTVLIECLPTDIPEEFTVDISKLVGIGAEVKVGDLPKSDKYVFLDPVDKILIQIAEAKKEEEVVAPIEEPAAEAQEGQEEVKDQAKDEKESKEEQPKK
ncbi:MAG: 50S ribosomal protein L25 [Candidatus Roizmanbacteria bacterium]|nr:50S ribosomal protein L25 [Candidatus Roizmanbacteria bacterium]